jgi:FkbM family methyltransferase
MSLAVTLVHKAFAAFGLRVVRARPANRFDAMCDSLRTIARAGFVPTIVIDAGANMGQWARKASAVFPDAPLHLIEPQAACQGELRGFASTRGSVEIHQTAITRPGRTMVRMTGATTGSTGAHVLGDTEHAENEDALPATTLDLLFAGRVDDSDRVLLKLDLEGHEADAIAGATTLLSRVEVLVTETQVYEIERNGNPTFADLMRVLSERGFAFYDVAALASRGRDGRLRTGDVIFVRDGSALTSDNRWV